jgi:hypothetical protein
MQVKSAALVTGAVIRNEYGMEQEENSQLPLKTIWYLILEKFELNRII